MLPAAASRRASRSASPAPSNRLRGRLQHRGAPFPARALGSFEPRERERVRAERDGSAGSQARAAHAGTLVGLVQRLAGRAGHRDFAPALAEELLAPARIVEVE